MGETQHRPRDSGLGTRYLYPVRAALCARIAIASKSPNRTPERRPEAFKSTASRRVNGKELFLDRSGRPGRLPELMCVQNCPGRDKTDPNRKAINCGANLIREREIKNWDYSSPANVGRTTISTHLIKNSCCLSRCSSSPALARAAGPHIKLAAIVWRSHGHRQRRGCTSIYSGTCPPLPIPRIKTDADRHGRTPV